MKRKIQSILTASISVLALTSLAQDSSNFNVDQTGSPRQHMNRAGMDRQNDTACPPTHGK